MCLAEHLTIYEINDRMLTNFIKCDDHAECSEANTCVLPPLSRTVCLKLRQLWSSRFVNCHVGY